MNDRIRAQFLVLLAGCSMACASSSQPVANSRSQESTCRSYALANNPDVTPPQLVRGDQPPPPPSAPSGFVCVRVTITESGSVIDPVTVQTDNQDFAKAFVASLPQWQYTPATRGSARVVYHTVLFARFPR
jgi:hypothetical protein